jgi:hypothetical protein
VRSPLVGVIAFAGGLRVTYRASRGAVAGGGVLVRMDAAPVSVAGNAMRAAAW